MIDTAFRRRERSIITPRRYDRLSHRAKLIVGWIDGRLPASCHETTIGGLCRLVRCDENQLIDALEELLRAHAIHYRTHCRDDADLLFIWPMEEPR